MLLGLLVLALPLSAAAAPKHPASGHDYKIDSQLRERIHKYIALGLLGRLDTVDVIVTFNDGREQLPTAFNNYVCGPRLDIINGYGLCKLPVSQLTGLSQLASVHRLHYNRDAQESDFLSSTAVQADLLTTQYGYNGAGVTVAFIDSGLTSGHPDLKENNILKFVDLVNDKNLRSDASGHGTHVTGIVAGTGATDSRFAGIASGTKIVSLKVLDENGKGSIRDIIAAMDWVAKNYKAYNIRIVNLSVGAGVYESYWTDPLTMAAKALVDKGITVVAAAGNFGKNAKGELQWGGITAPGVAPWVLTACAFSTNGTTDPGDDTVAGFSSSGPTAFDFTAKPDLCAPGVGIVSLAAPESQLYQQGLLASPSWLLGATSSLAYSPYISLTGTSQAAPFVTGTVAMMLQANPNLTPNLIKAILQYTAHAQPGVSPLRQGAGFLNAEGAVTLASFYAHAKPGLTLPVDDSWSQQIIWGNYLLSGGVLDPGGNAWMPGVEWGWAKTQGDDGDNIVWGTACSDDCDNIVWGTSDDGDNIVWGTSDDGDNIVWGTSDDDDNIVWGTADDADNIVWGTADDGDNIVWGTADDADNIVWGTDCGGDDCDNIVWGTSDDADNIVWGTADDGDNIVWGTSDDGDNIVWGTADDSDNIVWGTSLVQNIIWSINQSAKGGK